MLSFSVWSKQKVADNTYTQTEIDLKLQLQQKTVEGLQKDFEALQQQLQDNIKAQDKYIHSQYKKVDWWIGGLDLWVFG